jgi:hypothetical protein
VGDASLVPLSGLNVGPDANVNVGPDANPTLVYTPTYVGLHANPVPFSVSSCSLFLISIFNPYRSNPNG